MTSAEITRRFLAESSALPDRDLLARYVATRDGEAFALLVRRFGPLVLGTCQRVLGPSADADDAFQAVFLALARRASSFRDPAALPAWLHRVSLRTSRRALARRRPIVPPPDTADPSDPFADVTWKDVRRILDEELDRLPEKYRAPVVLCWLDGLTRDEAAVRLQVSLTTVKRRLEAGRELLRARLLRRGLGPSVAAVAVLDPTGLRAIVPPELQNVAARLADAETAVPTGVATLAIKSVGGGMLRATLAAAVAVVLSVAAGMSATSAGLPTPVVAATGDASAITEPIPPPRPVSEQPGDPLPAGVTAQFGSLRLCVPDEITTAAYSPDGKLLAVTSHTMIRVYEVANWKLLHRFSAPGRHLTLPTGRNLAFSADGKYLGFVKPGSSAYVWDLRTGKLTSRFEGGGAFDPDAQMKKLVPRFVDGATYLRDPPDWEARNAVRVWTSFCAFTPDGLFVLSEKERLSFHDPATGKEVRSLPVGQVIHLSPDGKRFVRLPFLKASSYPLIVGDATTGKTVRTIDSHVWWGAGRDGVAFSPDGKTLALALANTWGVELWDTTWAEPVRLPTPDEMLGRTPGGPDIGFTADGKVLFLRLRNGDLARWDAKTHKELPRLRAGGGPTLGTAYGLPGGKTALLPCPNGWVRTFDTATGTEIPVAGRYRDRLTLAPTPDGKVIAAGDGAGRIDLLDATTGERVRTIRDRGDQVREMVFSPNGKSLAISEWRWRSPEETSRVWQTRLLRATDGKELRTFEDPSRNTLSIHPHGFTSDSERLVIDFYPQRVRVIETASGKEERRFGPSSFEARLAPDGRLLATNKNGEVLLIDVTTGQVARRFRVQPEETSGLIHSYRFAWSADGKTLACALPDDIAVIVDPQTGRELRRFAAFPGQRPGFIPGATTFIQAVALTPDGKQLLTTALNSQAAGVWDTATGKPVAMLDHGFPPEGGFFTSDGKSAITFGSVVGYRWDLDAVRKK